MVTDKLVETWNENSGGGVVRQQKWRNRDNYGDIGGGMDMDILVVMIGKWRQRLR